MCKENREFVIILLAALLFCSVWGVLQGEEQPDRWYLISEQELQSIEQYKEKSELDRQNWLSQVRDLKMKAENSDARSAKLEAESAFLNRQLAQAREAQHKSETLYEQSEADRLTLISLKNGEIAILTSSVAAEKLKTQKARTLNVILGGIVAAIVIVAAVKLYLKIRTGGVSGILSFLQPP